MKEKTIRRWLLFGLLLALFVPVSGQSQVIQMDTDKLQLANQYYRNRDFEKAAVLYREIYDRSGNDPYFNLYLNCLLELEDFAQAEEEIRKQLTRRKNDAYLYVQWGFMLSQQGRQDEAVRKYEESLRVVPNNKSDYIRLASAFLGRQQYEFARRVYELGDQRLPNESFHYELARVYLYQRDYEQMFQAYLDLLKIDESNLGRVQSSILTAFRMDVDNSLRDEFRISLLRRIQEDPDVMAYNHLLIWLFIQENRFSQALRQAIALDKRIGAGDANIASLARIAAGNDGVEEAIRAYDYLIDKGPGGEFYNEAHEGKMKMHYHLFIHYPEQNPDALRLQSQFQKTFQVVGFSPETTSLVIDYAHFLAFYQQEIDSATDVLQNQMTIKGINALQRDQLKNELADIQVLKDDLWEAVLLYSQIIDANKNNPLGDEVKLKKAKLGYYMGNLSWAQAQLDVLKASTSKLIANDALELSIFISSNTALDTTEVPMQLFAKADLYQFRRQDSLAWATLDSIEVQYSYHSLLDDIYFRKAKNLTNRGDYAQAAAFLEKVRDGFAFDLLADDALFLLAELYEKKLDRPEEAGELYKQMLTQYPGSIFVEDARERYRRLRGEIPVDKETLFFNEPDNN